MTFAGLHNTGNGSQGSGFSCPIAANQSNDFAFVNGQRNTFQCVDVPVVGMNILNFKHCHDDCSCLVCYACLACAFPKPAGCPTSEIRLDDKRVILDLSG